MSLPSRLLAVAVVAIVGPLTVPAAAGTGPRTAARALCAGTTRTTGTVADPALVETSGLAWSRAHRGVLWAHNDSGDSARVFALARDGADLGIVTVPGVAALDWEDVALGLGPGGDDHLFLGDIGGVGATRATVTVVRIPEPTPPGPGATATSAPPALVTLAYPDGPHDAEALLVDDRTGDLVVVTKVSGGPAVVYRAPDAATAPSGSAIVLEAVGDLGRPTDPGLDRRLLELVGMGDAADLVTGADAAPDGRVAAVRTYGGTTVFAWPARTPLAEALLGVPCAAPAPLDVRFPQGEAIALAPDGRRAVTVSEGVGAPLVELRAAP